MEFVVDVAKIVLALIMVPIYLNIVMQGLLRSYWVERLTYLRFKKELEMDFEFKKG